MRLPAAGRRFRVAYEGLKIVGALANSPKILRPATIRLALLFNPRQPHHSARHAARLAGVIKLALGRGLPGSTWHAGRYFRSTANITAHQTDFIPMKRQDLSPRPVLQRLGLLRAVAARVGLDGALRNRTWS